MWMTVVIMMVVVQMMVMMKILLIMITCNGFNRVTIHPSDFFTILFQEAVVSIWNDQVIYFGH